jgi:uncharacterized protein YjbI with pentapeptide repeats
MLECGPRLMADPEHLALLQQGVDVWNAWRVKEPSASPDLGGARLIGADLRAANLREANLREANLREANLSRSDLREAGLQAADLRKAILSQAVLSKARLQAADLREANLSGAILHDANLYKADLSDANLYKAVLSEANPVQANLSQANLREANLIMANLRWAMLSGASLSQANLRHANLDGANLREANLSQADLSKANLRGANLDRANLSEADLVRADLSRAQLVETNLVDATLTDCRIYGISAWGVKFSAGTIQQGLIITRNEEAAVTVDDLEVAQFVYLLLHNEKIRRVIDTVGNKGVLLLGRFTEGRMAVLDRLRDELRKRDYLPIVQLRQARDEGLHGDGKAARGPVQVRHRGHHQPKVRAARTASDGAGDHGPIPAHYRRGRGALRHVAGLVEQASRMGVRTNLLFLGRQSNRVAR